MCGLQVIDQKPPINQVRHKMDKVMNSKKRNVAKVLILLVLLAIYTIVVLVVSDRFRWESAL